MEDKIIAGIKTELRKEPEDWSCRFSVVSYCQYGRGVFECEGKHKDRKHCPVWRQRS